MNNNIYIYGTGLTARHAHEVLVKEGFSIRAFLNRSIELKSSISDLGEVLMYNSIQLTNSIKSDSTVIVAIMNTAGDIRKVMKNLRIEGFGEIIPYAKLPDMFPDSFEFLYYEPISRYMERKRYVEEARRVLVDSKCDKRSIEVFDALDCFRRTLNYDVLPILDKKENQYLEKTIEGYLTPSMLYVDCGAFVGDTYESLITCIDENKLVLEKYIGIEADLSNYLELEKCINKSTRHFNCELYNVAVCEKEQDLHFRNDGSTASSIVKESDTVVKGKAIDDLGIIPTHIKMDIEGAETAALLGAEKTIRKYKPRLAICTYHTPEDFYNIILLINSWNLGYRFEYRVYEDAGVDSVLYAVFD